MTSSRKYALIGAVSAMLFCLSVGVLIRSCEMARLARAGTVASLIEKDADYWRPRGSHQR